MQSSRLHVLYNTVGVLLVIGASHLAVAQPARLSWSPVQGGPEGAAVVDLVGNGQGTVVAATLGGGIFESTDRGVNWVDIQGNLPHQSFRSVVISSAGTVLASDGESVWRRSGSSLWERSDSGIDLANQQLLDLVRTANGSLYATGWNIYRSDDDGLTWTRADSGLPLQSDRTNVRFMREDGSGNLLAAVVDAPRLYRSADGSTWQAAQGQGLPGGVFGFIFAMAHRPATNEFYVVTANKRVFRSSNLGDNWTQGALLQTFDFEVPLVFGPQDQMVVPRNAESLEISFDGGMTITQRPTLENCGNALALYADDQVVLAGSENGVCRVTESPFTWRPINQGLRAARRVAIGHLDGVWITGSKHRGERSTDGGASWTTDVVQAESGGFRLSMFYNFFRTNGGRLLAQVGNPRDDIGGPAFADEDLDTWSFYNPGVGARSNFTKSADGRIWYLANDGRLARSDDDGTSFARVGIAAPGIGNGSLAATPNGTLYLIRRQTQSVPSPNLLLRTSDDGQTWESIADEAHGLPLPAFSDVVIDSAGTIYVTSDLNPTLGPSGILRSTDGGEHFLPANTGLPGNDVFFAIGRKNLVVGPGERLFLGHDSHGVFVSDDGGDTWREENDGLPALLPNDDGTTRSAADFAFGDSGEVWVAVARQDLTFGPIGAGLYRAQLPSAPPTNTRPATATPTPTQVQSPTSTPTMPGPTPSTRAGDCNGDDEVTVDELILAVNIALGSRPVADCGAADSNDDGSVTVDELVRAVNAALGS